MKSPQVIAEEQTQASYWFTYKAANVAAFLFIVIAVANDHHAFGFFAIAGLIGFNAWRVPILTDEFAERLKHVTFKTQIENLYVFSEYADQLDTTVVATFKRTVEYLKHVGNTHEVRVHLLIFRDVSRFTWWWDANGKLQKESKERDKNLLVSSETWEQYCDAVDLFEKTDRDERLRQFRKDNAGFDWVNENVFHQWAQTGE